MIQATHFEVDKGWKFLIKDFNVNINEVLKRAGLPGDLLIRPQALLTAEEYFRLWESLSIVVNDPLFPLQLGQRIPVEAFNPPLFSAFCSPNLNIAMMRLSKYKQLIGPLTLTVDAGFEKTSIKLGCLYTNLPFPESIIAMEFTFLVNLVRTATREPIKPVSITTTAELVQRNEYCDFFGVTPVKGETNEISFSAEDARCPFLSENQDLWNFFEPQLKKKLADLGEDSSFAARVRSCLFELIPSGMCSTEDVAKKLAVSKRSLQRYLSSENTTFQKELNKTREKLAKHYLTNSTLSGAQISFLLGFDDPNSFVRAYRTWTGETPGQLRV